MTSSHSSRPLRFSWILPTLAAFAVAQACANRADDCDANSTCSGGNATAGSSTAGMAGDSGHDSGGSASGKAGATAGGKSGASGSPTGGAGNSAGQGGADAGAGGVPVTPPCGGDCPSAKPVCKEATDTCVECLAPGDCTTGEKTKCDTAKNTCVACLATTDCASVTNARCDAGACVKCETNDDCTHIAGKGVCAAGTCVQCTAADETACAGNACNPAVKACTNTPVGSVGVCGACLADSACLGGNKADPDSRCVPMEFNGTPRTGGFCLKRVAKSCTKPFQTPLSASSLSGATSEAYCGIDQDNVRCEAVLDLVSGADCSADGKDTSCGCARDQDGNCLVAGAGGLCKTVGVNAERCTYSCATTADCPGNLKCTLDTPYCH